MEVKIKKNVENTGEIKLGDIFYCERYEGYYIVAAVDTDVTGVYHYLQNINGQNNIFSSKEYGTLQSLREAIECNDYLGFTHYPSHKYFMELTEYPEGE